MPQVSFRGAGSHAILTMSFLNRLLLTLFYIRETDLPQSDSAFRTPFHITSSMNAPPWWSDVSPRLHSHSQVVLPYLRQGSCQSATDWVASTIDIYFLRVLEAERRTHSCTGWMRAPQGPRWLLRVRLAAEYLSRPSSLIVGSLFPF